MPYARLLKAIHGFVSKKHDGVSQLLIFICDFSLIDFY